MSEYRSIAYAVAIIRSYENKLLSRKVLNRMIDAPSVDDAYKILAETEYSKSMNDEYDIEDIIKTELGRVVELIEEITPDRFATDLFLLEYDIQNLKVLLKSKYFDKEIPEDGLYLVSTIEVDKLKEFVFEDIDEDIPEFIVEACQAIEKAYSTQIDPQLINIMLDRAYFEFIFATAKAKKLDVVFDYFIKKVDLINIKTLLRVKKLNESYAFLNRVLLPGGSFDEKFYKEALELPIEQLLSKMQYSEYRDVVPDGISSYINTDSLGVYEKLMDNYLIEYIKLNKYQPLSIEPVIGYLIAKIEETKALRMIFVSRANKLDMENVRERLREVYEQ